MNRLPPLHSIIPFLSHSLFAYLVALIGFLSDGLILSWWMIPMAMVVGNLADIDSSYSRIGRLVPRLSASLETNYGHRTITHSIWPILIIALIGWSSSFYLSAWWLPAAMYASHILLDMIIGTTGAPLFWPNPTRFYLLRRIKANSIAERVMASFLLTIVFILTIFGAPNINAMLSNATGDLDYAVYQYREWEPTHQVQIDIQGTRQSNHAPINGRYLVQRLESHTFYIEVDGELLTAGKAQQDIYLRHVVAVQGPLRTGPVTFPTVTPTPVIVTVRVNHVADPENEILVKIGDHIKPGDLLADLIAYKAKIKAAQKPLTIGDLLHQPPSPESTPTATIPPSLEPLDFDRANAILQIAIAQATAAANRAHPNPGDLLAAEAELSIRTRELQQAQSAYDAEKWQPNISMLPVSLTLERATNNYNLTVARATSVARIDYEAIELANARLQQDYIDYQRRIATPTPGNTPTPTRTPTVTPTATPRPVIDPAEVEVRSLITGTVVDVRIVSINGNEATVQISVQTSSTYTPSASSTVPSLGEAPREGLGRGETVQVINVSDGDTITVRFADGREEPIRMLDIDTPETVHPSKPIECGGPEASQHTKNRLCGNESGHSCTTEIRLESAGRDKYDRLLGYIWLDGYLYNEELVTQGLARHNDYGERHQYTERIALAEQHAQANVMGLWGACPVTP